MKGGRGQRHGSARRHLPAKRWDSFMFWEFRVEISSLLPFIMIIIPLTLEMSPAFPCATQVTAQEKHLGVPETKRTFTISFLSFSFTKYTTCTTVSSAFPYATRAIAQMRHLGVPEMKRKLVIIKTFSEILVENLSGCSLLPSYPL